MGKVVVWWVPELKEAGGTLAGCGASSEVVVRSHF